jgi:hypothetical protein
MPWLLDGLTLGKGTALGWATVSERRPTPMTPAKDRAAGDHRER